MDLLDLFDFVVVDWISLNMKGDCLDKLISYLSIKVVYQLGVRVVVVDPVRLLP